MTTNFPVGFHDFHKDEGLNFQLNRFYTSGILIYDEVNEIGSRVICEINEEDKKFWEEKRDKYLKRKEAKD